jgi:hypothetical protein
LLREASCLIETLPESDQQEVLEKLLIEAGDSINFCLENYYNIYPNHVSLPVNLQNNFFEKDLVDLNSYLKQFVNSKSRLRHPYLFADDFLGRPNEQEGVDKIRNFVFSLTTNALNSKYKTRLESYLPNSPISSKQDKLGGRTFNTPHALTFEVKDYSLVRKAIERRDEKSAKFSAETTPFKQNIEPCFCNIRTLSSERLAYFIHNLVRNDSYANIQIKKRTGVSFTKEFLSPEFQNLYDSHDDFLTKPINLPKKLPNCKNDEFTRLVHS